MKKFLNNLSIKIKIRTIPLIMIFIIITLISGLSVGIAKSKLVKQMKLDGLNLAKQVAHEIEKNSMAVDTINEAIEDKVRTLGNFLTSRSQEEINNDYLEQIAKYFKVDEINITDSSGKVIYSNLQSSIDAVFGSDHISYPVLTGKRNELMENIRKSRETDDYYKYGYIATESGGMIQIGILANKVNELKASLSIEKLIDGLVKDSNIVYAYFADTNSKITSASVKERIGTVLKGEGIKKVVKQKKIYTNIYDYKEKNIKVYDVLVPVYKNNEHVGVIAIGLSMENVYKAVNTIIIVSVILAAISFIIVLIILLSISKNIINPLSQLVYLAKKVAKGQFDNDIYIKSKDEIGVLSSSFKDMSESLRNTIGSIKAQAVKTENMSSSLTSNAQQMTSATNEVANAIQDVTRGASGQADDLVEVVNHIEKLGDQIENIQDKLLIVKNSSDETKNKANIGKEQIDILSKSIEEVKEAFEISVHKLNNLNSSVSQIGNITDVINEISEKTNLLALNAAIEAARAGEAGKGFAVVSDEIKKLAEQSKESTEDIQKLVQSISSETGEVINNSNEVDNLVQTQVNIVKNTVQAFEEILKSITEILPHIDDTYVLLNNTIKSKDLVSNKVETVSSIAEETFASSQEISASSEEMLTNTGEVSTFALQLNEVAAELKNEVNKFKI